jgi:hypothetical protein
MALPGHRSWSRRKNHVMRCRDTRTPRSRDPLLCKQSKSQAKSLPRLRFGESSVPLAAPILLQDVPTMAASLRREGRCGRARRRQGRRVARFKRPLPQSFPASPKAARAFLTTATSRLARWRGPSIPRKFVEPVRQPGVNEVVSVLKSKFF